MRGVVIEIICALWPVNSGESCSRYNVCFSLIPRPPSLFLFLGLHLVCFGLFFLAAAGGGGGGGGGGGRRVESAPPHRMIGLATPSSQFRTPLSGGGRGRAMPMNSRLVYSVPRKMS